MSGEPRYLYVAHVMRRGIGTGIYPVGSVLPTVAELALTYEVPPGVVGAALRELTSEGLVSGRTDGVVTVDGGPGSAHSSCLDG